MHKAMDQSGFRGTWAARDGASIDGLSAAFLDSSAGDSRSSRGALALLGANGGEPE